MGEWPVVRLEEACETITDGAHQSPKDCPGGLPMASVKDMARWGINVKSSRTISHDDFVDLVRNGCQPQIGDVLIAKDGATCLDTVCEFKQQDKIVLLSSIAILRPSRCLHSGYLRYYLDSAETRATLKAGYVSGSAIPRVVLKDFRRALIPLPPLPEQKAIAQILGSLDDKIELNRRMNATLEAMAQALFKSWFVNFDPVRAKLDGRQPAGLDPETTALFPARFQDSILGPIPQGWRACTLGEIARNVSITFDFSRTPEVVFINTGDVLEGDFLHSKRSVHFGLPGQAKKSIQPDDILFSEIRPANKRFAYVDFDSNDYVVSTKFMIIRALKDIHPRLLYRILTTNETLNEFQVQAESRSGTFPQITFDSISHLPIVLPPLAIQGAYQRAVKDIDAQIKVNKQQSRTLAILRDTLLPKLLSGEIRIH